MQSNEISDEQLARMIAEQNRWLAEEFKEPMIEVGQIVKYRERAGDETGAERYMVLEVNGDRCFIQYICDWTFKPTSLARTADLEVVASREAIAEFVRK